MPTQHEIVQAGIKKYAVIEMRLEQATRTILQMEKDYRNAYSEGLFTSDEYVDAINRTRMIAGQIAAVTASVYSAHRSDTEIVKKAGADIAEPYAVVKSIPTNFVRPMDGGGSR